MRTGFRLSAVVSVVVLALTALVPAGAAAGAQAAVAPTPAVAAVVTPSAPHTLYVSVANRYLTMPHRIAAGTYYVQVRTSDARSWVQVVRPPAGYTSRQFLAATTLWRSRYNSGADPRAAYAAFVRSVSFVGGADVARGAVGTFAQGFTAGTYWLYEDSHEGPTHLARIVVLTVVGTPPAQTPVPAVGLVRFSATAPPTLPGHLPGAGWLKAIGGAPLNSLEILKLRPGVTQADLDTFGVCFTWDSPPHLRTRTALTAPWVSAARYRRGSPCTGTTACRPGTTSPATSRPARTTTGRCGTGSSRPSQSPRRLWAASYARFKLFARKNR